jgi:hypothetical protein
MVMDGRGHGDRWSRSRRMTVTVAVVSVQNGTGTVWSGMKRSGTVGHVMVTFPVKSERFTVFYASRSYKYSVAFF